jgi:hypothetical protein
MEAKMVVVATTLQRSTMCQRQRTIRNKKKAIAAFDAAMPIYKC